jgi:hypothetical protein
MVDYVTLQQRQQLYDTTITLCQLLCQRIQEGQQPLTLNEQLLKRLIKSALKCAGFTQAQKAEIRLVCGANPNAYVLAPYADHWLFQTIGPKKGAELDVIMVC